IGCDEQGKLIFMIIDRTADVAWCRPLSGGIQFGEINVIAAKPNQSVGSEIQYPVVYVNTRRDFVVNRVDRFAEIFCAGPFTIFVEVTDPDVTPADTAAAVGDKVQRSSVGGQGGLRLPFGTVHIGAEILGCRPLIANPDTLVQVTTSVTLPAHAGCNDQFTPIGRNGTGTRAQPAVDVRRNRLGLRPSSPRIFAGDNEVLVVITSTSEPPGKDQLLLIRRQHRKILHHKGVHRITQGTKFVCGTALLILACKPDVVH